MVPEVRIRGKAQIKQKIARNTLKPKIPPKTIAVIKSKMGVRIRMTTD